MNLTKFVKNSSMEISIRLLWSTYSTYYVHLQELGENHFQKYRKVWWKIIKCWKREVLYTMIKEIKVKNLFIFIVHYSQIKFLMLSIITILMSSLKLWTKLRTMYLPIFINLLQSECIKVISRKLLLKLESLWRSLCV